MGPSTTSTICRRRSQCSGPVPAGRSRQRWRLRPQPVLSKSPGVKRPWIDSWKRRREPVGSALLEVVVDEGRGEHACKVADFAHSLDDLMLALGFERDDNLARCRIAIDFDTRH